MSFYNRNRTRERNNRDRGLGIRRDRRLRVLVHFDAESEELRQILQIGVVNLTGQPIVQPPQPSFHNRPSIGIPVDPMSQLDL